MSTNQTIPYLPTLPRIDHTNIEYDTLRNDIQNYIFSQFPNNWNDFLESNAGQMMLEMFSYFGDQLGFRIDAAANECYLPTAQHRESILKLLHLIDYQMLPIQQSSLSLTALRSDGTETQTYDVLLNDTDKNLRTVLTGQNKDGDSVSFTVLAGKFNYDSKVVLPRPKDYIDGVLSDVNPSTTNILAYEGLVRMEILDNVTGEDNQIYYLRNSPVVFGSVKVYLDKGNGWELLTNNQYLVNISTTQSSSFLNPVYRQEWDSEGRCRIMFGEAKYGPKPEIGHRLRFQYMTGIGTKGNIGRNGINQSLSCDIVDWMGRITDTTRVLFNNAAVPSFGGRDQESVEEARTFAPLMLRTAWKANTREDHNILITGQPSVRLAKAASDNENDLIANYTTMLYIVPNSIQNVNDYYQLDYTIQQAIETYLNGDVENVSHKIIGLDNVVVPAHILEMEVTINIIKKRYYDENVLKSEILSVFKDYFDPYLSNGVKNDDFDFGRTINIQDFELKIKQIPGVDIVSLVDVNFSNPFETQDENGNNIYLPPYPNHEEIVLQTKRMAMDARIEILYELANYNMYEDLGNEYLESMFESANLQNVDSNYRCYAKLANSKRAINYLGRQTTMANCWLRFAYNKADAFSFRTKVYSGKNPVFSNGTLSSLALPAIVKNSLNKTTVTCSTACASGDTYFDTTGQPVWGRTLLAQINGIEVRILVPSNISDDPEGLVAAINDAITQNDSYSFDLLQAFVTIDRKIGFHSNFTITFYNSNTVYPLTVPLNAVIGLSPGIYTMATTTNYLPCASNVLLKDGENTLLFRINGKEEKVTLPISNPSPYFVYSNDKINVGTSDAYDAFNVPVVFRAYPDIFDWVTTTTITGTVVTGELITGAWQLSNRLSITNDKNPSITSLYIRISKSTNGYFLVEQPDVSYNSLVYRHWDYASASVRTDGSTGTPNAVGSAFTNWKASSSINLKFIEDGLYCKTDAPTSPGHGSHFVATTQRYYYVSSQSDEAWIELANKDTFATSEHNLYKYMTGNDVNLAPSGSGGMVNSFIWEFLKENALGGDSGYQEGVSYLVEIKARKEYDIIDKIVSANDSAIISTTLTFTPNKDNIDLYSWTRYSHDLENTYQEEGYDDRLLWLDDDINGIQQDQLQVRFFVQSMDGEDTELSGTLTYECDIVDDAKAQSLITLPEENLEVGQFKQISNMVVDFDEELGYVTILPTQTIPWSIESYGYDNVSEAVSGTITFPIIGMLVKVVDIVTRINDPTYGLSKYITALLSDDGQQVILVGKTLQINLFNSLFVGLLNMVAGTTLSRKNTLTINRTDLYDGENEILVKTSKYYVRIVVSNSVNEEVSTMYIPFYYYRTYDYIGAMNREKLAQEIFYQIPNTNTQTQNIIVPQEYEIPILNDDKFVVNVS